MIYYLILVILCPPERVLCYSSTGAALTGEMTMRKDGFYMPARVLCGDDAVRKYAGEMKKFGSKALIVTGKHSADACGVYADICAALDEIGTQYCRFSDV